MKILVLNGPNLNMLGVREEDIYGSETLEDIEVKILEIAKESGCEVSFFQSNAEHELIESIHQAFKDNTDAIIFNPAGYTHTSVALRDAILAVQIPFFEVHISDINSREDFRKKSYFSDIAKEVFSGHGTESYILAFKEALKINR
jgi:3-dehydroquinate dehydratase-2|tara:strand:- start:58 stop:492 length:435 start_codon:yes stop_codon:yes gene_type:complete